MELRLRGAREGRGQVRSPEVGPEPAGGLGLTAGLAAGVAPRPGGFPPAMEDELSFSDIYGGRLALQRRYYSPSCREFCLSCPRLSLRSLTAVTCTVWLAAYGLFTLCEVIAPRPFPRSVSGTRFWKGLGIELRPLAGPSCSPKAGGQELAVSGDAVPLLDSILNYI